MHLLNTIFSLLAISLFVSVSNAAQDKLSRFTALQSKSKAGVLKLDDQLFADLIVAPRNYTAVILLTALGSKYGCQPCNQYQSEYELLSKSWLRQQKHHDPLFFAMLDFSVGEETFKKIRQTSAPIIFMFPPTKGPHAQLSHYSEPFKFEFTQGQVSGESTAHWISQNCHHAPKLHRPYDYAKLSMYLGLAIISLATLKLSFNTIRPALSSRNLWAGISLILILLFISGHMFNHIRHVPYVVNNGPGGVSYIAGGFGAQFGLETQIIAVAYAILAFSTIALGLKVPRMTHPGRQTIAVWAWSTILLIVFSFLISIFKIKNGAYPFYLPPFRG